MLYSRAGDYPSGQPLLFAESFSPNTPEGACPSCHGLGRVYDATEASMVRDAAISIREGAVAAWPGAWQGQNLRDIVTALGIDIDTAWRDLPKKDRDWLLFTDEQPQVPVWPHSTLEEVRRARQRKEKGRLRFFAEACLLSLNGCDEGGRVKFCEIHFVRGGNFPRRRRATRSGRAGAGRSNKRGRLRVAPEPAHIRCTGTRITAKGTFSVKSCEIHLSRRKSISLDSP
jgi:hypothetical protein